LFQDKNLPRDEIESERLARMYLPGIPDQGYLTISNALQWRLQYQRVINEGEKGGTEGIHRVT
jgi:hypothetical protein